MNTAFDEVQRIIETSALSQEDKDFIIGRLANTAPVFSEITLKALTKDPTLLHKLLSSLKEKVQAQGNDRELEAIALREKEEVLEALRKNKI
jgi:hypothetical protein